MQANILKHPPLQNLKAAGYEIQQLLVAHANITEGKDVFESWVLDDTSIFIRSGLVYLCSVWEAFVEDAAETAVAFLVENAGTHNDVPLSLRREVAKQLESEKHDLAVWGLARDGWRDILKERFETVVRRNTNRLNAPKTENVKNFFFTALGHETIVDEWSWSHFSNNHVCTWLDRFVDARGAIAHGREPNFEIGAFALDFFYVLVLELGQITHNSVRNFLLKLLDKEVWQEEESQVAWKTFENCATELPFLRHVHVHRSKDGQANYLLSLKHMQRIEGGE